MISIYLTDEAKSNLEERIANNPNYPNPRIMISGYS